MPALANETRAVLPTYTLLDVAKHNSPQDAWIIVSGKVYNVTQFAQEHPGGEEVLLDSAGRDATREFEDVGHSADARARLESLVIGTVRQATDEELRISKGHIKGDRRSRRDAASVLPEVVKWVSAHSSHIRQVGTASAVVLMAVYFAKRYIAPYMPGTTKR